MKHDWTYKMLGASECMVVCMDCGAVHGGAVSESDAIATVAQLNGSRLAPSSYSLNRRMREARKSRRV